MKKLSIVLVIVIILSTALCGCGTSKEATKVETPTNTIEEEVDISIFKEVETSSKNINVYRQEVISRLESLKEDESFITDEEWKAISNSQWLTDSKYKHNTYFVTFSELNEETSEYYYPVVFRDGTQLILWYTTESGSLLFEKIHGYGNLGGNYGGKSHYDISNEITITSKIENTVTYSQETGEVKVWKFGEVAEVYNGIPADSEYCGHSTFEGYIFRNGTDVYSLKAIDTYNGNGSVVCIAHDVKYVIDSDYYYGSDPWCQPLFLMTDGSIKAYIGYEGNQEIPDDVSHLCDLQFEGGWDK